MLLISYVVSSCFGLYLMKAAESSWSTKFAIGLIFYGSGAALWLVILRLYPLSVAFPVAAGALMVGTTLAGHFALREPISLTHLTGIFFIAIGIIILASRVQNP